MVRLYKRVLFLIALILILSCVLTGCSYEVHYEGIDNFDRNHSATSINRFLLPSDDFIEKFEYLDGEYYYNDVNESRFLIANSEQSIVILEYSDDVYLEAKNYCIDNMELSDVNALEYKGYTFIENVMLAKAQNTFRDEKNTKYPRVFNMFAYNDDESCLVFMGFYNSPDNKDKNVNLAESDWEAFIDIYFSQYYNFGN